MKKVKHLWIALLAMIVVACGGVSDNNSEIVVKPVETDVSGDMEGCFKVVDKEYKASGDWGDGIITVEIERTDEDLPFDLDEQNLYSFSEFSASDYIQVGFGIEFLDEDGNVLDKVSADGSGLSGSYSPDEAKALVKLKPGKKGSIRFEAVKGAVGFRITSAYEEHGNTSQKHKFTDDDDDDSVSFFQDDDDDNDKGRETRSAVNSSSIDEEISDYLNSNEEININIDEWLDGYEKILDRALKYADGYLKGDPAAIEQYNKILHESLYYSKTGGQVGRYFVRSGNPVQRNKYNRILEKANQLAEISMKR